MLRNSFHYNCTNSNVQTFIIQSFYVAISFILHKSVLQNFENYYNSKNFSFF